MLMIILIIGPSGVGKPETSNNARDHLPGVILQDLDDMAAEWGVNQIVNGKHLYPAHPDRTLMDVKAGEMLVFKRRGQLMIKRLKPWRTRECKDDTQYEEIVCGREWEAG